MLRALAIVGCCCSSGYRGIWARFYRCTWAANRWICIWLSQSPQIRREAPGSTHVLWKCCPCQWICIVFTWSMIDSASNLQLPSSSTKSENCCSLHNSVEVIMTFSLWSLLWSFPLRIRVNVNLSAAEKVTIRWKETTDKSDKFPRFDGILYKRDWFIDQLNPDWKDQRENQYAKWIKKPLTRTWNCLFRPSCGIATTGPSMWSRISRPHSRIWEWGCWMIMA